MQCLTWSGIMAHAHLSTVTTMVLMTPSTLNQPGLVEEYHDGGGVGDEGHWCLPSGSVGHLIAIVPRSSSCTPLRADPPLGQVSLFKLLLHCRANSVQGSSVLRVVRLQEARCSQIVTDSVGGVV
jgi:hypothetical protein